MLILLGLDEISTYAFLRQIKDCSQKMVAQLTPKVAHVILSSNFQTLKDLI